MKSSYFAIFIGILIVVTGMLLVDNVSRSRQVWTELEALIQEENEINVEWNQLRLEESMLATGVLLDQDMKERLGMVVPESNAIVYVSDDYSVKRVAKVNSGNKAGTGL